MRDESRIAARRHPHQVLVAAVLVAAGLPVIVGGPRPGSLAAALPAVLLAIWGTVLVVGGLLVLAAAVVRSALTALYLERAADLPLAVMCVVYGGSVWIAAGPRGWTAAVITLGFAAAFGWRGWQVRHSLRDLRRRLAEEGR